MFFLASSRSRKITCFDRAELFCRLLLLLLQPALSSVGERAHRQYASSSAPSTRCAARARPSALPSAARCRCSRRRRSRCTRRLHTAFYTQKRIVASARRRSAKKKGESRAQFAYWTINACRLVMRRSDSASDLFLSCSPTTSREMFSTSSSSWSDDELSAHSRKKSCHRLSAHFSTSDLTTSDSSISQFMPQNR